MFECCCFLLIVWLCDLVIGVYSWCVHGLVALLSCYFVFADFGWCVVALVFVCVDCSVVISFGV